MLLGYSYSIKVSFYAKHSTVLYNHFWLRPSNVSYHSVKGSHLLPDELSMEHIGYRYSGLSVGMLPHSPSFATLCIYCMCTDRSTRSTLAGHVLIVYRCSLLCTHQKDMTAQTPTSKSERPLKHLACLYHQNCSGTQQA